MKVKKLIVIAAFMLMGTGCLNVFAGSVSPEQERLITLSKTPESNSLEKEEMQKLLAQGVNPNVKDEYGFSPLYYACSGNNSKVTQLLLNYGADANMIYQHEEKSTTALLLVLRKPRNDYVHKWLLVSLLLSGKADPNFANQNGDAPLFFAVRGDNTTGSLTKLLITNGAAVNHTNKNGNTALHEAVKINNKKAAQALLEHGADATLKNKKGKSALDLAIESNSPLKNILLPLPPLIY
jgi:ankyrin repeat protein